MDGRPRGLSLSPNDRFLVAGGEDQIVTIWDLEADQPLLIDRIPIGAWASDTTWITESTLGVAAFEPGSTVDWRTIDINPTSVLDAARDSVLRGFTQDECTLYQIPSCGNDAQS